MGRRGLGHVPRLVRWVGAAAVMVIGLGSGRSDRAAPPATAPAAPRAASTAPATAPATAAATRQATGDAARRVDEWVAGLSDPDWRRRDKAVAGLAAMGEEAEPRLREVLRRAEAEGGPAAESRKAIVLVLAELERGRTPGSRRVTLRLTAVTAPEALMAFSEQTGTRFTPDPEDLPAEVKERRFDLAVDRVPMWEALLELCARCGLSVVCGDAEGRVTLAPPGDKPPRPAAAGGPLLVTVPRVEVNLHRAVEFPGPRPMNAANAHNTPPCRVFVHALCEPKLNAPVWFIDSVDQCVTDDGAELRSARGEVSGEVNSRSDTWLVLNGPVAGAKRITRLKLSARAVVVGPVRTIELPDPLTVKSSTQNVGGFRVVINDVNRVSGERYAYSIAAYRDDHTPQEWRTFQALMGRYPCTLQDADGRALNYTGGSSSSSGDMITANNQLERNGSGPPAKLGVGVPSTLQGPALHT